MREIKFRAWDKKAKKMLYAPTIKLLFTKNTRTLIPFRDYDCANIGEEFNLDCGGGCAGSCLPTELKKVEIMQYTGLLDRNGKEIYESDFVKVGNNLFLVSWYEMSAAFWIFSTEPTESESYLSSSNVPMRDWNWLDGGKGINWHNGGHENVEVIGNIYENPELLSEVK